MTRTASSNAVLTSREDTAALSAHSPASSALVKVLTALVTAKRQMDADRQIGASRCYPHTGSGALRPVRRSQFDPSLP